MAYTKNPLRYPPSFFQILKSVTSNSFTPLVSEHETPTKAKNARQKFLAFRAALKAGGERWEADYATSLRIMTSLEGSTLTLSLSLMDDPFCEAEQAEQAPQTPTGQAPTSDQMLADHKKDLLTTLSTKIRTQLITMMEFALDPSCPTPEEEPVACVLWLTRNHPSWQTPLAITAILSELEKD
jgi:hypothetical protein